MDHLELVDDPRPATLVAEVKDDMARRRTREFMQVLEARKVEADETELIYLDRLIGYLIRRLEPPCDAPEEDDLDRANRHELLAEHRDELERTFPRQGGFVILMRVWVWALILFWCSLALAFCSTLAHAQEMRVVVHEVSLPDLVKTCSHGERDYEPDLLGCEVDRFGVCHVYVLPLWVRKQRDNGDESGYHETLGHELRHCSDGFFHGEQRGVSLPLTPQQLR